MLVGQIKSRVRIKNNMIHRHEGYIIPMCFSQNDGDNGDLTMKSSCFIISSWIFLIFLVISVSISSSSHIFALPHGAPVDPPGLVDAACCTLGPLGSIGPGAPGARSWGSCRLRSSRRADNSLKQSWDEAAGVFEARCEANIWALGLGLLLGCIMVH